MNTRNTLIGFALLASGLVSGVAHAALEGRDLDGNLSTFEAYYDTVLNLTWLGDANYAMTSGYATNTGGRMIWSAANTWAANLSFTDGVNVYDNWRLPTVEPVNGVSFNYNGSTGGSTDASYNITSPNSEMAYMFYVNLGNPGNYTPLGVFYGCLVSISDTCLNNVGPFSNLQGHFYWSGTLVRDGGRVFIQRVDVRHVCRLPSRSIQGLLPLRLGCESG